MKSKKCKLILVHQDEMDEVAEIELGDLLGIGMGLVVLTIGLAIGLQITGDIKDDMEVDSLEYNATLQGQNALAKIPAKLGLVVTVLMASVIIGLLVRHLWMKYAS